MRHAAGELLVGAIVVFLLAPVVVVMAMSFTGDAFLAFPPRSWGLDQYAALIEGGDWSEPLTRSLGVAAVSAAVATVIGALAALALGRTQMRGRTALQFLGLGPLLAPAVAYAIALYALFSALDMLGTPLALVLSHVTIAVPLVLLITAGALGRIPRDLELAAMSLGASRRRAWRDITLPILRPALLASAIFAFISSFDEAVISSFLGYETLPVAILNSVRYGVDPAITAIATLLTIATAALLGATALLRRSS